MMSDALVYSDDLIRRVLETTKTIAMVGASNNPARPSYLVLKYLQGRGFRMIAVNPLLRATEMLGAPIHATLAGVGEAIDMVDIFRNAEAADAIVDEALTLTPRPKVIWMQLGVRNDVAAARAQAAGVTVIMNRCPKIEYGRLTGEIGWTGVNSRRLSSKRPVMMPGFQKRKL